MQDWKFSFCADVIKFKKSILFWDPFVCYGCLFFYFILYDSCPLHLQLGLNKLN